MDHFLVFSVTARSASADDDSMDQFLVFSVTAGSASADDDSMDHFLVSLSHDDPFNPYMYTGMTIDIYLTYAKVCMILYRAAIDILLLLRKTSAMVTSR